MSEPHALGDRVLVKRVHPRQGVLSHIRYTMGKDDPVLQLGEVVSVGPAWDSTRFADHDLKPGDLVVYPTPRVHDHFLWGNTWLLVVPGYWIAGIVTDTYLADHPEAREYGEELAYADSDKPTPLV